MDFALLIGRKDYGLAGLYTAGSVTLSFVALFAALMLVRSWPTEDTITFWSKAPMPACGSTAG
jgi:hypothetical protein